jgi:DNA primase
MPVTWRELEKMDAADRFTLRTATARKNPWPDFFSIKQRIDPDMLDYLRRQLGKSARSPPAKKRTGKA